MKNIFKPQSNSMFIWISLVLLGSWGITGCGTMKSAEYVPPNIILPAHIKTIAVRSFANETQEPGVGTKLWLAVTDEFIRDGRIAYTDNEKKADGIVVGTVKQYIKTELAHDVNLVPIEYQLRVLMNLQFLDVKNNQYLWEEPNLDQRLRYFVETEPGGMTEEQARDELWDRFATDVVRRTIEGFGTVTGTSPKNVPNETIENPPPKYPSSAPF